MKKFSIFILVSVLAFGCREGVSVEPELNDGEFSLEVFDGTGKLVLTKKGVAENLSDLHWELRLNDPLFGQPDSDPLETFASLTFVAQSAIRAIGPVTIDKNIAAQFHQRWYSAPNDWGYRSTGGSMLIEELSNLNAKGNFEIELEVADWAQANPRWGDHITIKGNFSSTCPFLQTGGCK